MHTISVVAIALTISLQGITAYPRFVSHLPNGNAVPGVNALGHRNSAGGGALNVFGEAFEAHNTQWSAALCHLDSDGDGATNGEELGDPCCKWTEASTGKRQLRTQVSHPGVANTWTSMQLEAMKCKEDFSPEATTAGAAVADAAPTTTAPPVTSDPQSPPFNATVGVNSSASTTGSGDGGDELPSTVDPNGLKETPPSLVPGTPTPTTKPKTATPTPPPAKSGSSGDAGQHSACMVAAVVAVLTAGIVM
ncbi:hypothetical protein Gpo141_00008484 [Globisporangium polare]